MSFRILLIAWAAAFLMMIAGIVIWFVVESTWFMRWRRRRPLPRAKARIRASPKKPIDTSDHDS